MSRQPLLFSLLLCAAAAALPGPFTAQADPLPSQKILERYQQMLEKSPVEGIALERLWKAYGDAGQTAQLVDYYQKAASAEPGSFAHSLVLGYLLRKTGQLAEARAAFEKAAQREPKSPLPWLALAKLESGRPAEAAGFLEKALPLFEPKDPRQNEALLELGGAWLAAGNLEKAAEAWERTLALDPENQVLRQRLADNYARNRLPDRAIPHWEWLKTHGAPADRAQALQALARIHQGAGRVEPALAALEEALAGTAPGNWLRAELQAQIIRLHQRTHRVPELEARWKNAVQTHPRDAGALLQLVDLYERLGDLEQQRIWLEKLCALLPRNTGYRVRLARVALQLDDVAGAAALYDELLREQPLQSEWVFERARIDLQQDAPLIARQRIGTLLAERRTDETVRHKALEFFETHRLTDLLEQELKIDAGSGREEAVVALTRFYFQQKRYADAERTLEGLLPGPAERTPARLASAYARMAGVLREHQELDSAVATLQKAIALQPDTREHSLLLGELLAAQGKSVEARLAYEKAFTLSKSPAEALEIDQKLFELVRTPPRGSPAAGEPSGRPGDPRSPEFEEYVLKLRRAAASKPSVDAWLRVAHWQLWGRNLRVAQECAQQALKLKPDSVAGHEFLVKLALSEPQAALALEHLEELMRIQPEGRPGYLRRAGQAVLQTGRLEDALKIFRELAATNPGDFEVLGDLALTLQRAERWDEALEIWKRAEAVAPGARKKEAATALLRIYERMGMPEEAVQLLVQQMDAQTEERERFSVFQDLLAVCAKNGRLDWLRGEFEQRCKLQPEDYFSAMGLGLVFKAQGDKKAAFERLSEASLSASNLAEALPGLIREAEDLHKLDAAVRLQEQWLRIAPAQTSEGLQKLAQLQEKNFDLQGATQTWTKVVAKFPRDPAALRRAAEFHLQSGLPARATELLRKVRVLEPNDLSSLAQLAELDLEAGAVEEAQDCLEQILRRSTPEKPGEPLKFPGLRTSEAGRLQSAYLSTVRMRRGNPAPETYRALRSFWMPAPEPGGAISGAGSGWGGGSSSAGASVNERDLRLGAIRDLGGFIQARGDAGALAAWVERWKKAAPTAPTEALWAFYFAGAGEALLDETERFTGRVGSEVQATQAFIWFALQTGQFDRLAKWLHAAERSPTERDYLQVALSEYFQASGIRPELDQTLLEKLFSEGYRTRIWQVAMTLAQRGRFREALHLGHRVLEGVTTQKPGYCLELAHWSLILGDLDGARATLKGALDHRGESLELPVFAVLREYYLLLPERERAGFKKAYLEGLDPMIHPVHTSLASVLLHALEGETADAQTQLRFLLKLRPLSPFSEEEGAGSSAARFWNFVLGTASQLQAWHFERLATQWCEMALEDAALLRLQTETTGGNTLRNRAMDVRTRLDALRLLQASPAQREQIRDDYARVAGVEGLVPLAETLAALGAHRQSIALYRDLWEKEPTNPQALRNLLGACRTAKDIATLQSVLEQSVTRGYYRLNEAAQSDLILQWAEALESAGAPGRARAVLQEATSGQHSQDSRLLGRLAQIHERTGDLAAAERVYRRLLLAEPANAVALQALTQLLETQGRFKEALAALEKATGPEIESRRAALWLKAGQLEEAFSALERSPVSQGARTPMRMAEILLEKGDRKLARSILRKTLSRPLDPRTRFSIQSKLIEWLDPGEDTELVAGEFKRLRRVAGEDRDLVGNYYRLRVREGVRFGLEKTVEPELLQEWEQEDPLAGLALAEWQIQRSNWPAAKGFLEKLVEQADTPESVLQRFLELSLESKRADCAVPLRAALARRNPLETKCMLDWARALFTEAHAATDPASKQDFLKKALSVLGELQARCPIIPGLFGELAPIFVEFGFPDRAAPLFREAQAADPLARDFAVYLRSARLHLAEKDFAGARRLLQVAFGNPANLEGSALVELLEAENRLDRCEEEMRGFGLDAFQQRAVRRALFDFYARSGDGPGALRMVQKHPELADAALCKRLRSLCSNEPWALSALFEALLPGIGEVPALEAELATLYTEWADAGIQARDPGRALALLRRAQELRPLDFAQVERFSALCAELRQTGLAVTLLEELLRNGPEAAQKEKARKVLSRLKSD
jgi:tetratricopeptide (TPR) repeat protein